MKKTLLTLILVLLTISYGYSQAKFGFSIVNPRLLGGFWVADLKATILAGQTWKVGSSNIRINFTPTPAGALTVKADNPALNANTNISNANGYQAMTTTSVNSGTAIGVNILTFNTSGFYMFTPGTYTIASIRFNIVPPFTGNQFNFRVPPAQFPTIVFDSTVALTVGTQVTTTDPPLSSANEVTVEIPKEFALMQNYPNPFNPTTSIRVDVPFATNMVLKVYDVTGAEVATLVNEKVEAGVYNVMWDASKLASGVYFYTVKAGDFKDSKKMILIK